VTAAEERVDRLRRLVADMQNWHRIAQSDQLPIEFVEYLPGGDATIIRIYELMQAARRRVYALDLAPWLSGPGPSGYSAVETESKAIRQERSFRSSTNAPQSTSPAD
jgi:hypothetical protein